MFEWVVAGMRPMVLMRARLCTQAIPHIVKLVRSKRDVLRLRVIPCHDIRARRALCWPRGQVYPLLALCCWRCFHVSKVATLEHKHVSSVLAASVGLLREAEPLLYTSREKLRRNNYLYGSTRPARLGRSRITDMDRGHIPLTLRGSVALPSAEHRLADARSQSLCLSGRVG